MSNALLLTERDVRAVLPMPDLIAAMEGALAQFSAGAVRQPVRTVIEVGRGPRLLRRHAGGARRSAGRGRQARDRVRAQPRARPALAPGDHRPARSRDGRARGDARRPLHHRSAHGRGLGRVGEAPGAAGRARAGIIGSGVQARSHLEAIRHVRALDGRARLESERAASRGVCVRDVRRRPACRCAAVATAAAARRAARTSIVLATSSRTPVIDDADVAAGAHIAAVGACRPDQREMPTALVARARVFVDSRAAARQEAGDLLIPHAAKARSATITSPANWATSSPAAWPDGWTQRRSRSSSRSASRSRTWWPRIWRSTRARAAGTGTAVFLVMRHCASRRSIAALAVFAGAPRRSAGAAQDSPADPGSRTRRSRPPTTSITTRRWRTRGGRGARSQQLARASRPGVHHLARPAVPARRDDGRSLPGQHLRRTQIALPKPDPPSWPPSSRARWRGRSSWRNKRLKQNPNDVDAMFDVGAAYGVQASYVASVEGSITAAFRYARRAFDTQSEVLDRDPVARVGRRSSSAPIAT